MGTDTSVESSEKYIPGLAVKERTKRRSRSRGSRNKQKDSSLSCDRSSAFQDANNTKKLKIDKKEEEKLKDSTRERKNNKKEKQIEHLNTGIIQSSHIVSKELPEVTIIESENIEIISKVCEEKDNICNEDKSNTLEVTTIEQTDQSVSDERKKKKKKRNKSNQKDT